MFKLLVLAFGVFALAAAQHNNPAPNCHQELGAVLARVANPTPSSVNCSYVHYSQAGAIQWVRQQQTYCADSGKVSNGIPRTAYSQKHLAFYWVSGTGQFLWQIGVRDGSSAQIAQLPGRYNYTLGIAKLNTSVVFVTTDAVYTMVDGSPLQPMTQTGFLAAYKISKQAVMASDGNNIYIADGATLFTFNNNEVSSFVVKPMTQMVVLQWAPSCKKLLTVSDNIVYLFQPNPEATQPSETVVTLPFTADSSLLNTIDAFTGRPEWYYVQGGLLHRVDINKHAHIDAGHKIDAVGMLGNIQFFN